MEFWNKLFYKQKEIDVRETPPYMPQNAPGLPWCEEDYDPMIDRGPNSLSSTGLPLPAFNLEERGMQKAYFTEEGLPPFSSIWRLPKIKNETDAWKSLLYEAPFFSFLKDEIDIQRLFQKTLRAALEDLAEFPAEETHTVKAGERLWTHENAFHLLITVTGRPQGPLEAEAWLRCNQ